MKIDFLSSRYGSIQDWLIKAAKFSIYADSEQFVRYENVYRKITIPFSALEGHTVDSFARLAKHKGWLPGEAAAEIDKLYRDGE